MPLIRPMRAIFSSEDLQVLVNWIDAGAPGETGENDPLQVLSTAPDRNWRLGEPDYIVQAPRQDIPPTGVLDYTYENAELGWSEEKWVSRPAIFARR